MDDVSDWMMIWMGYVKWEIIRDDTIHIQIMMIRYRMRCAVDGLSWWIGVQSITSIYLMYSHRIWMKSSINTHIILSYPLIILFITTIVIVFIIQSSLLPLWTINEMIWITQYPWFKNEWTDCFIHSQQIQSIS